MKSFVYGNNGYLLSRCKEMNEIKVKMWVRLNEIIRHLILACFLNYHNGIFGDTNAIP